MTETDLFKDKADEYDKNDVPARLSAGIGAALGEHAGLREGLKVMDFGAGTGLVTKRIVDRVGRVTAVDVSPAMLAKLEEKEELRGKVDAICQDILDRPLDDRFDVIVSAMAMHHVENTEKLFETLGAHLVPGGRVALADLDKEDGAFHPDDAPGVHHSGFDRSALQAVMEKKGFSDVKFFTAVEVEREGRRYPVFLVTATKR